MGFKEISTIDVLNIIKSIRKTSTYDNDDISTNLGIKSLFYLVHILRYLINQSFEQNNFPTCLKSSKAIPIQKSKDTTNLNNFRPISILPFFSKIIEKSAYNQIYIHLKEHNNYTISSTQFGFQKQLSTDNCLNLLKYHINNLDNHKIYITIFFDLSKAFDHINHKILINKLKNLDLSDDAITWFNNYLKNRYQITKIGGHSSSAMKIKMGVSQGSILGPLLFLIYINDFPVDTSYNTIIYVKHNELIVNTAKTNFLIFHNNNIKID